MLAAVVVRFAGPAVLVLEILSCFDIYFIAISSKFRHFQYNIFREETHLVAVILPAATAAPLDPVTLIDVVSVLIRPVDLFRFDARILQLVAVFDAGAQLAVLLHHQLLHVLVVAIQQRFGQRGRLEALRRGGVAVAGGVGRRVASTCRAHLIVRAAAQILRAAAAARAAPVYR